MKACDFLFAARVAFWVILIPRRKVLILYFIVEPPGPTGKISRPLFSLQVKSRPNRLGRSKDASTERTERQLDTNTFDVPVAMKLSLTSGFVQRIASTLHSSFMMPAWELLQWKMTRKHTYKPTIYRREQVCAREQNINGSKWCRHKKPESSVC